MRKFLVGLGLGLSAAVAQAQSTIVFDVVFDQVYEASGTFAPNLVAVAPGPFNNNQPIAPPNLHAHVTMTAVASGTQLTGVNTIKLNGTFSTESGNSPSNGWSVHTFDGATFNLLRIGANVPNSYFATDFVGPGGTWIDWPIFTATAANLVLSDHGPASGYGGTCPYFFGCLSAQPAGNGAGTGTYGLFPSGTNIYNTGSSLPSFPTLADSGSYALITAGSTYSQTNPSAGLGFDNGLDAFAFDGVLDTTNTQGNGTSQPYPDGVNGYPGKVRILTFSNTGNTAYMVEGHIVAPIVPDTDTDGIVDGLDNCPTIANWNQADSDGDGRGNACDNCTLRSNSTQLDADQDGIGNRCDPDFDQNNFVTAADFGALRSVLNQQCVTPGANTLVCKADLDGNGFVTSADFGILRGYLNGPPGPSGLSCAGTIPCTVPNP